MKAARRESPFIQDDLLDRYRRQHDLSFRSFGRYLFNINSYRTNTMDNKGIIAL